MKKRRWLPRRAMKGVPGVMQLLSKRVASSGRGSPRLIAASRAAWDSLAVLKRLERCWFILARGATPEVGKEKGKGSEERMR